MDNVTPLCGSDVPPEDPVSFNDLTLGDIHTVRHAAARLGIRTGLAYELARAGPIPAKRLGRRWVVSRGAVPHLAHEMLKGA